MHDNDGHMTKVSAHSQFSLALCLQFHYCRKAVFQIESRKETTLVPSMAMLMVNLGSCTAIHVIYSLALGYSVTIPHPTSYVIRNIIRIIRVELCIDGCYIGQQSCICFKLEHMYFI